MPGCYGDWASCDWCTPRKLYHPTDHPSFAFTAPEEAPRMTPGPMTDGHPRPATVDLTDCTWCGEPGTHLGCQVARIEALAKSTFEYVETLDDADMANVYAGKALGLSQAARMLRVEAKL